MQAGDTGNEPAKPADEDAAKEASEKAKPAEKKEAGDGKAPARKDADRRKMLRAGVVGIAVVVALIAWLATRGGDEGSSEPTTTAEPAAPRIVTVDEMREAAADLGQPIYWAGPIKGKEFELKELGEGVQVLYQPAGTAAGEGSAKVLTVGSYPLEDPAKALEGFAERPGAIVTQASDGSEVVSSKESPTSAYFTSPDNSVQVEVYDPSVQRAMSLATSGKVEPVG